MTDNVGTLFVCLADYNCSCRPPGKAVTRSTVRRHRKQANQQRASFDLPPLPNGPRYSSEASERQVRRHDMLFSPYNVEQPCFRVKDISSQYIVLGIGDCSPPISFVSHFCTNVGTGEFQLNPPEANSDETPRRRSLDTSMNIVPLPPGGYGQNEMESLGIEGTEFMEDYRNLPATCDGIGFDDAENEDVIPPASPQSWGIPTTSNLDDQSNTPSTNEEAEMKAIRQQTGKRARAMVDFYEFCQQNKEWISLGIDFALTREAMNRILKNISAPYKIWVSVRRNLEKYSELYTEKYWSCRGHMLLSDHPIDEYTRAGEDLQFIPNPCIVCHERKTSLNKSIFEYIPLEPRLRKWLLHEESYKQLFEYWSSELSLRATSSHEVAKCYSDIFDGSIYRFIVDKRGGIEASRYDIFLDISFDGFQTFANNTYDCWPLIAMIHNLPPSLRYLTRNVVPLGFVKGPNEPVRLDTFLRPFITEVNRINNQGKGTMFVCADGVRREVMVHVLWCKSDTPAAAKCGGFKGSNAKYHCRFCNVKGHYNLTSRHYYYPSRCLTVNIDGESRQKMKVYYNPKSLPRRNPVEIKRVFAMLENPDMTKSESEELRKSTGISRRTSVFDLSSMTPFVSFPIDIMHLIMNLVKDLVALWKGDTPIEAADDGGTADFLVSSGSWDMIDMEMRNLGAGTSQSSFGRRPRDTSVYMKWKAEECKNFIFNYALVVMEGHLPRRYLKGARCLSCLLEICSRPFLTAGDLDQIEKFAISYFKHFEEQYYLFKETRVRICKSTLHSILHLRENIERCGPLVCCSQFWMERYINTVKHGLNATNMAAESLTENAKLLESFKLFFGEPFVSLSENHNTEHEAGEDFPTEEDISSVMKDPVSGAILLTPKSRAYFSEELFSRYRLRDLLMSYSRRCLGLSTTDAARSVSEDWFIPYGRVQFQCGAGSGEVGSMLLRRSTKTRGDYYVAARYTADSAQSSIPREKVYYGRIYFLMKYEFCLEERREIRCLFVADWAKDLRKSVASQVYSTRSAAQVFGERSIEEVGIIMHGVGFMIHQNPEARTKRPYFLDPQQRVHHLLERGKASPDGVDRVLVGVH